MRPAMLDLCEGEGTDRGSRSGVRWCWSGSCARPTAGSMSDSDSPDRSPSSTPRSGHSTSRTGLRGSRPTSPRCRPSSAGSSARPGPTCPRHLCMTPCSPAWMIRPPRCATVVRRTRCSSTAALLVGVDDPPWVLGTGTLRWISAAAGVAVIPIPLALLWGQDRRHGLIAGWSLAALLHVSAAIAALLLVIDRADRIGLAVERRQSTAGGSASPSAGAVPASSTADGGTKPSTALNENR